MECQLDGHDFSDYEYETLFSGRVVAALPLTCTECERTINEGEAYDLYRGLEVETEREYTITTCSDCKSIQDAFWASNAGLTGQMLDTLRDHIVFDLHGSVDSKCILPLTPAAKARVFEMIEEAWDYCDDDE
jgi:hypothetical protein